jgi:translocation and assembly module TamB
MPVNGPRGENITETEETSDSANDAGGSAPETIGETPARRRILTRRNAAITAIVAVVALFAILLAAYIFYRTGQVDRIIADQIKGTLREYGIRAEIEGFETQLGPRTVLIRNLALYDEQTGEQLARVNRLVAVVRIEDLYALSLRRNVNLESLEIDGLEAWVVFDEEGRTNFRNIRLPEEDPNRRILFAYSTARVRITNSILHYADARYEIGGEARNVQLTVQPDDPSAPAESWMNTVALSLTDSTFTYQGRPVNNIDIEVRGRVNQTRAEIQELVLRSPVTESRLTGVMDDWRALRYNLAITSSVDVTQISDLLQTETALRGAGRFTGTVQGEGENYTIDGRVESDALAAANVRLSGVVVTGRGTGQGEAYEAQGRAVAEILTVGDFRLSMVQIAGGVMGTGADFRFLGELRSAAARSGANSISGLIITDALAESRDGELRVSARTASANSFTSPDATVRGFRANDLRLTQTENGATSFSASAAGAQNVTASGARIDNVTASGVTGTAQGDTTNVTVNNMRVGALRAAGAQTGSINIAGVRLAIREGGRVTATSNDINAGTVAINANRQNGRVENLRLANPVFVLEPSGRYRASADLSLGGGVLGEMRLGAARSAVVATNNQIQLNNFTAEVFNGRAMGDVVLSTGGRGASRVNADFTELDVGNLIAAFGGRVVPLSGDATGYVRLTFPGTNFEAASGEINARIEGETGDARTPVTGEVAVRAERGTFNIDRANLQAGASRLNAAGQFSFDDESNLALELVSNNAAELQRIVASTGLVPELDAGLREYGVELAGDLNFTGTLRGALTDPLINGRASLATLIVNNRNIGSLAASINSTPTEIRITDGRLTEPDGGGAQFTATLPRGAGTQGISIDATLERANGGNIVAALGGFDGHGPNLSAINLQSELSGRINVTGLPNNATGEANLRFGEGQIESVPFNEITARATFAGSQIELQSLNADLRDGQITASGRVNTVTQDFDLQAQGSEVGISLIRSFAPNNTTLEQLEGTLDFTARASGNLSDQRTYNVTIDGTGRDVRLNNRSLGELALVGRTENQRFNVQLTTGILGQPQVIAAQIDFSNPDLPTTIETALSGTDLTQLFATLLPQSNVRVTGRATGTLRASGNLFGENAEGEREFGIAGLRGTATFTELGVQIEDVQLNAESPLVIQFASNEVVFERTRFTGPGTNLLFGGTAALGAGGRQNLTVDGELNLRVLNGISPNIFLSGIARVGVRVSGSFEQPRLTGSADVNTATISALVGNERLMASNVTGRVIFTSDQARIETLTGRLGNGRVQIAGGALLNGFRPSQFRLTVRGENMTVPFPEDFRSTADADIVIQGSLDTAAEIRGTVNLRRAEYTEDIDLADFVNRRVEGSLSEGGGGGSGGFLGVPVRLDLRVEGRDALVVRNNLADAVGSVTLQIRGSIEDPLIAGRVVLTRGTLTFRNDRYEITRGLIDLPARRDADPILNLEAQTEIRGYRVTAAITGPLSQPQATVRSDPALPQADVVALITTGDLATGDNAGASTLAQSGLGTATSLLTDTLINAPVQRATDRLFGLNRFEIEPLVGGRGGASPTARLTVGRRINRNLSVTYSTNVTTSENQVATVEYRLSDRFSFVAQYERGSLSGLRTEQNNFSFEIRFRKRF